MRFDGRADDQMRPVEAKVGVLENADGSAYFAFGKTRVIAGVYGPRPLHPKHLQDPEKAVLRVSYNMLPFSVPERKKKPVGRREIELSRALTKAFESVIFLDEFPRSAIDVYVLVIQADAGTRTAAVNAISMALADAGVPMKGLVGGVAAGKVGQRIVIDLNKMEEDYGTVVPENDYYGPGQATDCAFAYVPRTEEITLMQMDGKIPMEDLKKVTELAIKGMETLVKLQKKALLSKYEVVTLESED